jgi:ABC-2 type transport system permease protein
MTRAFRSEWHKLMRRSMLLSGVLVVGLGGLVTFLVLTRVKSGHGPGAELSVAILSQSDGWSQIISRASDILGLIVLGIAAVAVASEYTHGTLRNLLVREPHRLKLLAGKSLAVLSFLGAIVFAASIASLLTALLGGPSQGIDTSTWTSSAGVSSIITTTLDVIASGLAYAIVGGVLALILKSSAAAITAGAAWLLLVESLIVAGWSSAAQWLPGRLFNTVASAGSANIGYQHAVTFGLMYLGAAAILAAVLFRTQDVKA